MSCFLVQPLTKLQAGGLTDRERGLGRSDEGGEGVIKDLLSEFSLMQFSLNAVCVTVVYVCCPRGLAKFVSSECPSEDFVLVEL